jgi:hypothetical protein
MSSSRHQLEATYHRVRLTVLRCHPGGHRETNQSPGCFVFAALFATKMDLGIMQ